MFFACLATCKDQSLGKCYNVYKMPVPKAVGEVRYPSSKLGDTLREGVDAGVGLEGVEASGLGERTVETSEWATIWIHWCYLSSLVTLIFLHESALSMVWQLDVI